MMMLLFQTVTDTDDDVAVSDHVTVSDDDDDVAVSDHVAVSDDDVAVSDHVTDTDGWPDAAAGTLAVSLALGPHVSFHW